VLQESNRIEEFVEVGGCHGTSSLPKFVLAYIQHRRMSFSVKQQHRVYIAMFLRTRNQYDKSVVSAVTLNYELLRTCRRNGKGLSFVSPAR
jgi:hypothetical protein